MGAALNNKKADLAPLPKPALIPQPNGGALYAGGVPGHDGSNAGRRGRKYYQRAEKIANDDTVWDVQHARAKAGDIRSLRLAVDIMEKGEEAGNPFAIGGEFEQGPNGKMRFTLMIGEKRDRD